MKKYTLVISLYLTASIFCHTIYGMETNFYQRPSSKENFVVQFLPKKIRFTKVEQENSKENVREAKMPVVMIEEQTLTVKNNDETVGELIYTYAQTTHEGYIRKLAVKKDYRNRGLGRMLMQTGLADLENRQHCSLVRLLANPDEKIYIHRLVHFYENFGFKLDKQGIMDCGFASMKKENI